MVRIRQCLIALTVLLSPLSLAAEESSETPHARASLDAFSENLSTLHAHFHQTIVTQDGRLESEGRGEIWLQHPGRFRWAYLGDYPELIVADGERLWLYDELLEQVTVKNLSVEAGDSPLMLLTNPEALDEQFTARDLGDLDGMMLLELASKNLESEFERILLGFRDNVLVLMSLEDAFGLRTDIRFSDLSRNPTLDQDLFRFVPPENADVVGEEDLLPATERHSGP